jgi:hypothetical protein
VGKGFTTTFDGEIYVNREGTFNLVSTDKPWFTPKQIHLGPPGHKAVRSLKSANQKEYPFLAKDIRILNPNDFIKEKRVFVDVYNELISTDPNKYTGEKYSRLLPNGVTQTNYVSTATNTPDSKVNNKVRWLLQYFHAVLAINSSDVKDYYAVAQSLLSKIDAPDAMDKMLWGIPFTGDVPDKTTSFFVKHTNNPEVSDDGYFRDFFDWISPDVSPQTRPEYYHVVGIGDWHIIGNK